MVRKLSSKKGLLKIQPVVFLSVLLCLVILAVYAPLKNNGFINFDDNLYVTENEIVKRGLTIEGIKWAFQFNDKGYWQPLTWLSHMADCELFGLNPAGHHFISLIIHIVNTLLLFWVLNRTTKCVYRSALVAVLFALHPLNVESVAWVAERKNVLSTFFWFLTIYIYTHYVRNQNIRNYIGVLVCFVFGLMTKPMAVTIPFLMLLLDFWPLNRIKFKSLRPPAGLPVEKTIVSGFGEVRWLIILLEKIPLLIMSVLSLQLSIFSLRQMEIMVSGSIVPLNLRLSNALVSYISYINKIFWPRDLAIFYPFPKFLLSWQIVGSVACLIGISLLSLAAIRRRPYVFVGWFWYVGTLLPVIGLVQTGMWPALADRWVYVPAIGLFVIIVWGISDLCWKFPYYKSVFVAAGAVVLLVFAFQTRRQLHNWVDSVTLFQHTLQTTGENEVAHYSLGDELVKEGKLAEGIEHYRSALRLKPGFSRVHNNLGVALALHGDTKRAVFHFQNALQINPNYADAHNNLGVALKGQGQLGQAANHFLEAIRLAPGDGQAYNNMGILLMQQGKVKTALEYFKKALNRNPDFIGAQENIKKASADIEKFKNDLTRLQHARGAKLENP